MVSSAARNCAKYLITSEKLYSQMSRLSHQDVVGLEYFQVCGITAIACCRLSSQLLFSLALWDYIVVFFLPLSQQSYESSPIPG